MCMHSLDMVDCAHSRNSNAHSKRTHKRIANQTKISRKLVLLNVSLKVSYIISLRAHTQTDRTWSTRRVRLRAPWCLQKSLSERSNVDLSDLKTHQKTQAWKLAGEASFYPSSWHTSFKRAIYQAFRAAHIVLWRSPSPFAAKNLNFKSTQKAKPFLKHVSTPRPPSVRALPPSTWWSHCPRARWCQLASVDHSLGQDSGKISLVVVCSPW